MRKQMKTQSRKSKSISKKKQSVAVPKQPEPTNVHVVKTALEFPPPEYLLEKAMNEPNRLLVEDYSETIRVLRDKGFSFREIAEWLTANGVGSDHNTVYRTYTKGMTDEEVAEVDQADHEEDRDIRG
jgi:hypothetical protein